jgi:hypothetical protein
MLTTRSLHRSGHRAFVVSLRAHPEIAALLPIGEIDALLDPAGGSADVFVDRALGAHTARRTRQA